MENAEIAHVLSEVADLLELTGGNAFKVRAYRQAAQVVDLLPRPVSELRSSGELTELPGIGAKIAAHIGELLGTGRFPEHQELAAQVPPGLLEILEVEGVGPKTAGLAWKSLGVTTLEGLEECCRDGRLEGLPRMGEKRVKAITEAISRYRGRKGRLPIHRAMPTAEALAAMLRKVRGVERVEIAGSLRRRKETVGDIDLLAASDDPEPVLRAFATAPDVAQVIASGPTKCSVRLRLGIQSDLRVVPPQAFGAALHYFTGSKTHNIAVRWRAVKLGLKLSEYGIFDRKDKRLGGATEEELFRAVGLPWIPPELREGTGELEAAEAGRLPHLVEEDDLLGDLHVHSTASSDGRSDLDELAAAARGIGLGYLAITDHSKSRPLGLDEARLAQVAAMVRAKLLQSGGPPVLLAGIEVDILPDGSLDLPLPALGALDWVVASVHTRFNQPSAEMTERMIRAIRSGVVDVLGHPSGRQLGMRDASQFDLGRVLEAAREEGVALEVNATPERLDLTDKGCRQAKAAGVKVALGSDAHNASQLGNLRYGIWVARRGWLEKSDVLNALGPADLLARKRTGPRHMSAEYVPQP